MNSTPEVSLTLSQKELALLHSALCDYRGKLGNLIGQMASMQLETDEAQALSNLLGDLSRRMCDLMVDETPA